MHTGTLMAVSLSQYCIAWTAVMDRIPPEATLASTTTATISPPIQVGQPVRWVSASPAPRNCGSR